MTFGLTFLAICLLYIAGLIVGYHLARHKAVEITEIVQRRRPFADPLTRRFQQWCRRQKMIAVSGKRWARLWLLISANNLGAVALVGRTIYGLAIVPAVYVTYRQGVTHGVVWSHPAMRPRRNLLLVMILEFGAYLIATTVGVNLVIAPLLGERFIVALRLLGIVYPLIAAALLSGALVEVDALRSRMPSGFTMPSGLTMDQVRAKALEGLKRQGGGT